MTVVQVSYFSDVLCIWAYAAQARIDAVKEKFGDTVRLDYRFCSVFGDTARKITSTWRDKGEYAGFKFTFANSGATVPAYRSPSGNLAEDALANVGKRAFVYDSGPAMGTGLKSRRPKRISDIDLR